MRSPKLSSLIALSLLAAVPAIAQIRPASAPFRVNRTNDFKQVNPVAAFSPSGAAFVVWENDQAGIRGAFQNLNGTAAGPQLTLVANEALGSRTEATVRSRKDPAVAALPGGQFLLAWTEEKSFVRSSPFHEDREVQDQDVYVQRFSATGTPIGTAARANGTTVGFQAVPKIAVLADGNAIVLWKELQGGISARFINASGQPSGNVLRVSTDLTANHGAVAASGKRILIAWDATVDGQDDTFGRFYEINGRAVGTEFRVNPTTPGMQRWPAVAAGSDGNFLLAWQSYVSDRSDVHIFGQILSANGGLVGSSFAISASDGTQLAPALAATKAGFIASWLDGNSLGYGIEAVPLNRHGARDGGEIRIADARVRKNYRQSIAANGNGGFLVPWETNEGRAQVIAARGFQQ